MAVLGCNIYFLVTNIWIITGILLGINTSDGCLFGTSSNCAFQCHCESGWCDANTGACQQGGPCATNVFTWGGPACQIGNVAFGKWANQTGQYEGFSSGQAVDGEVIDHEHRDQAYTCAHPNLQGTPATWTVDLGAEYKIYNVTLFNTDNGGGDFRLNSLAVTVIGDQGSAECGYQETPVPRAESQKPWKGTVNITCAQPLIGRYVTIQKTKKGNRENDDIDLFTICEVVVWGHKYIECSGCQGVCDEVLGCMNCPNGKKRPTCTEACDVGTYGENCQSVCSGHCDGSPPSKCDVISGGCSGGCQKWYIGAICNTNLVVPDGGQEENTTFQAVTSSSLEVVWEQETSVPYGGESYYGYIVAYKTSQSNVFTDGPDVRHSAGVTWTRETLPDLQHNTEYEVKIRPYREWNLDREVGLSYSTRSIKTACMDPGQPVIIGDISTRPPNATPASVGSFIVKWQLTDSGCDSYDKVYVEYRLIGETRWIQHHVETSFTESTITPASAGTYDCRITAINNRGLQSSSDIKQLTVAGYQPPTTTTSSTAATMPTKSIQSTPTDDTALIAGVVVAVVVVLVIIIVPVVIVMLRKRRHGANDTKPDRTIVVMNAQPMAGAGVDNQSFTTNTETEKPGAADAVYGNIMATDLSNPLIPVDKLDDHVRAKKANMPYFSAEYQRLPKADMKKCTTAEKTENRNKNRYVNICAYDHTRVVLDLYKGDPNSDYINANYITGYKAPKAYVATQGPRPHTTDAFWRMIWQVNTTRIIMVTALVENTKKKCDRYWPMGIGSKDTYADITVTNESLDTFADYVVRVFSVEKDGESRTVRQFNFLSWQDKSKPEHGTHPLLAFRRKVRSFDGVSEGPMVVHCSAGVGRTGTYIAIDSLLDQAAAESHVDIVTFTTAMRRERMNMIQTKDQYVFVHEALAEALKCPDTAIPCDSFAQGYADVCEGSDVTSIMQHQYEVLCDYKPTSNVDNRSGSKNAKKKKVPTATLR